MPFDPDAQWTCNDVRDCLLFVTEELKSRNVLTPTIFPDTVDHVLSRCKTCRSNPGKKPKACVGWILSLKDGTALTFAEAELHGRTVQVFLEGHVDCRMASPNDYGWAPARSSVAVSVQVDGTLQTRQHLDLAEPRQCAPMWHLQLGGLPGSLGPKGKFEWLDVPRWPAPPMDVMLAVDLVLYSVHYETWRDLADSSVWTNWIQRSEALVLTPYIEQISKYWRTRHAARTWLYAQCNKQTPWPRRSSSE